LLPLINVTCNEVCKFMPALSTFSISCLEYIFYLLCTCMLEAVVDHISNQFCFYFSCPLSGKLNFTLMLPIALGFLQIHCA
jgi:hypothetical protein